MKEISVRNLLSYGTFNVPFSRIVIIQGSIREELRKFIGVQSTLFLGSHDRHRALIDAIVAEKLFDEPFVPSIPTTCNLLVAAGDLAGKKVTGWQSMGYSFETPPEIRAELHRLIMKILESERSKKALANAEAP